MDRAAFIRLLGPCEDIIKRNAEEYAKPAAHADTHAHDTHTAHTRGASLAHASKQRQAARPAGGCDREARG